MVKLVLEKTEDYNKVLLRREDLFYQDLEDLFAKEFENIQDLSGELHRFGVNLYIPSKGEVKIDTLPYTIKEWPIMYHGDDGWYGHWQVGKIKVVE